MNLHFGTRADIINSVYFSLAGIACLWLITLYGWESKGTLYLIAGLLVSQTITLIACLLLLSHWCVVALNSAPNFTPLTRKLLRLAVMIVPIPAIAFCSATFFCIATYDESPVAESRLLRMWQLEQVCFGKSKLFAFIKKKADPAFYQNYKDRVRLRLINAIDQSGGSDLRATVNFTVLRDGSIKNLHICNSSGIEKFDQEALQAVQASSPFPAIPANQPDELALSVNVGDQSTVVAESSNPEFADYVNATADKIFKMWNPPEENQDVNASFTVEIRPDGTLAHIKSNTSGIREFDQSALNALTSVHPFEKFPTGINRDEEIFIEFKNSTCKRLPSGSMWIGPQREFSSIGLTCKGLPASISDGFARRFDDAVAACWRAPKSAPDSGAYVTFDLTPQGIAINAQVAIPSNNKEFDQSALAAVQQSRAGEFSYSSVPVAAGIWFSVPHELDKSYLQIRDDSRYVTQIPHPRHTSNY